jgi:magnesium transporter
MGGIAGSQVLTLVIRGQALGHLSGANFRWLFNRELIVAAINGALWAVVIAVVTFAWFHDIKIALIIGSSIIINLLVAAITGAALPLILKARGIDPALAGGVILTTVTDVVGFMTFLGLATLFYL